MDFIHKSLQEMKQKLYQAYWLKMHYMTNITMLREKNKIKFDSMGVILMWLSSFYAAYGPGIYGYIIVVIETTQTCLNLGGRVT